MHIFPDTDRQLGILPWRWWSLLCHPLWHCLTVRNLTVKMVEPVYVIFSDSDTAWQWGILPWKWWSLLGHPLWQWQWLTVRNLTMKMVEPAVSSSLTVTVTDSEESYCEDGGACCVILSDTDTDWQWRILPWRWWSLLGHPLWHWQWLTVRNLTMKMVEPAGSSSLTVTVTDSEESYREDGGACCVILSDSDSDWQWGILPWRWWSLLCHPLWQWQWLTVKNLTMKMVEPAVSSSLTVTLTDSEESYHEDGGACCVILSDSDSDWQWGILPWIWWSLLGHPLWQWHWLTVRNLTMKMVEPAVSSSLTVTLTDSEESYHEDGGACCVILSDSDSDWQWGILPWRWWSLLCHPLWQWQWLTVGNLTMKMVEPAVSSSLTVTVTDSEESYYEDGGACCVIFSDSDSDWQWGILLWRWWSLLCHPLWHWQWLTVRNLTVKIVEPAVSSSLTVTVTDSEESYHEDGGARWVILSDSDSDWQWGILPWRLWSLLCHPLWQWLTVKNLTMKMVEPAVSSSLTLTVTDSEESYHEDGGACWVILSDTDSDWQWGILPWRWWSLLCHPLWQWHWLTVGNLTMKMVEPAGSSSLTMTVTDSGESYHEDGGACWVILSDTDSDWQWGILPWRWWSLLCHPLWQWHWLTVKNLTVKMVEPVVSSSLTVTLTDSEESYHEDGGACCVILSDSDSDWQWGILLWRWWSLLCHPLWQWHWLTVKNLTVKMVEPVVSSSLTVTLTDSEESYHEDGGACCVILSDSDTDWQWGILPWRWWSLLCHPLWHWQWLTVKNLTMKMVEPAGSSSLTLTVTDSEESYHGDGGACWVILSDSDSDWQWRILPWRWWSLLCHPLWQWQTVKNLTMEMVEPAVSSSLTLTVTDSEESYHEDGGACWVILSDSDWQWGILPWRWWSLLGHPLWQWQWLTVRNLTMKMVEPAGSSSLTVTDSEESYHGDGGACWVILSDSDSDWQWRILPWRWWSLLGHPLWQWHWLAVRNLTMKMVEPAVSSSLTLTVTDSEESYHEDGGACWVILSDTDSDWQWGILPWRWWSLLCHPLWHWQWLTVRNLTMEMVEPAGSSSLTLTLTDSEESYHEDGGACWVILSDSDTDWQWRNLPWRWWSLQCHPLWHWLTVRNLTMKMVEPAVSSSLTVTVTDSEESYHEDGGACWVILSDSDTDWQWRNLPWRWWSLQCHPLWHWLTVRNLTMKMVEPAVSSSLTVTVTDSEESYCEDGGACCVILSDSDTDWQWGILPWRWWSLLCHPLWQWQWLTVRNLTVKMVEPVVSSSLTLTVTDSEESYHEDGGACCVILSDTDSDWQWGILPWRWWSLLGHPFWHWHWLTVRNLTVKMVEPAVSSSLTVTVTDSEESYHEDGGACCVILSDSDWQWGILPWRWWSLLGHPLWHWQWLTVRNLTMKMVEPAGSSSLTLTLTDSEESYHEDGGACCVILSDSDTDWQWGILPWRWWSLLCHPLWQWQWLTVRNLTMKMVEPAGSSSLTVTVTDSEESYREDCGVFCVILSDTDTDWQWGILPWRWWSLLCHPLWQWHWLTVRNLTMKMVEPVVSSSLTMTDSEESYHEDGGACCVILSDNDWQWRILPWRWWSLLCHPLWQWQWQTVRNLTMNMVEPAVSSFLTVTLTDSEDSYHEDGGACCVILSDSDWQWGILPWRWWSLLGHPLWQWHWLTVGNLTMKMVEPAGSSSLTVTLTDSEESYHEDGGACCVILSDSDSDWQWGILLWRWWSLLGHPLWQWHWLTVGNLTMKMVSLLGHPLWQWHWLTVGNLTMKMVSLLGHPLWQWHWLTVRNLTVKMVEPVSSSLTVTDSGRLVILGGCLTLVTDMYTSSGPAEYTPSEASTRNVYTCAVPRHSNKFFVVLIIPTKINLKIRKSFYVYFGSLNKPEAEGITFDHIGLLVLIKVSIRILIFLGIPKFLLGKSDLTHYIHNGTDVARQSVRDCNSLANWMDCALDRDTQLLIVLCGNLSDPDLN